MSGILIDSDGREFIMPPLFSFELQHTSGGSADSFEVSFLYTDGMKTVLENAVRFRFEHDGATEFYGIVDEYGISIENSKTAKVCGRGMAAVLMDNEAEAADFKICGLNDILSRYCEPFGVKNVITDEAFPRISGYSVKSGESCFSALCGYTDKAKSITPRFDREGNMILSSCCGKTHIISDDSPIFDISYKSKRYGMISKVIVKTVKGKKVTVTNDDFIRNGVNSMRVTMANKDTSTADMRYIGEKLIRDSMRDKKVLALSVPTLFFVFPMDRAEVNLSKLGISGSFTVSETVTWADGKSAGTRIYLTEDM